MLKKRCIGQLRTSQRTPNDSLLHKFGPQSITVTPEGFVGIQFVIDPSSAVTASEAAKFLLKMSEFLSSPDVNSDSDEI